MSETGKQGAKRSRIIDATQGRGGDSKPKGSNGGRSSGLGRIIIAVYGVLALSATVRAVFQIMSDFSAAPLAYLLSALAGLVYIVATLALASKKPGSWKLSWYAVWFERSVSWWLERSATCYRHSSPTPRSGRTSAPATDTFRWCCR